jgi:hypothetical protein
LAPFDNFPDLVTTTLHGCSPTPAIRTVSRGLSFLTVSAPTKIASHPARNFCTSARALPPVTHLFPGTAKYPSNVSPNFNITQGSFFVVQCR